jgi:hypothetical protein
VLKEGFRKREPDSGESGYPAHPGRYLQTSQAQLAQQLETPQLFAISHRRLQGNDVISNGLPLFSMQGVLDELHLNPDSPIERAVGMMLKENPSRKNASLT